MQTRHALRRVGTVESIGTRRSSNSIKDRSGMARALQQHIGNSWRIVVIAARKAEDSLDAFGPRRE